jgi:hypothetical protein
MLSATEVGRGHFVSCRDFLHNNFQKNVYGLYMNNEAANQ